MLRLIRIFSVENSRMIEVALDVLPVSIEQEVIGGCTQCHTVQEVFVIAQHYDRHLEVTSSTPVTTPLFSPSDDSPTFFSSTQTISINHHLFRIPAVVQGFIVLKRVRRKITAASCVEH
eukprot:GHVQ01030213.1.p2 GENE.GHVQ01030213.1~~GHVQ01030213.1.p2  ORF type:complete len:119 (+),score=14.56 GHVQ01030213.1:665-1021(+)